MARARANHDIEFLAHFSSLEDPRQQAKVLYPLDEILLLCLCGVLSGADSWVEIAAFGRKKLAFLRRFLPYAHGTPSHDQIGDVFATLDAKQFQQCFIDWVSAVRKTLRDVVAVDGKTLRRSFDKGGAQGPIHMVSAWSARQRLVLGQAKVADKSNEIVAIPALLELLSLNGAIVTIDAMGCQRDIAAKIIDKQADYVLALKGNQGSLRDDVELFFTEQRRRGFADAVFDHHTSVDGDHGRIETRRTVVTDDIAWLAERHDWPGLTTIAMVEYAREQAGKTTTETRFYISSLGARATTIADAIRRHWGVENGLHWVMDMVFRDDECRIRTNNAPANFAAVKHMASNLLRTAPGKESMRLKRHLAAWDDDFLFNIITQ